MEALLSYFRGPILFIFLCGIPPSKQVPIFSSY